MSQVLGQADAAAPRVAQEPLVANGVASVNRLSALRSIFEEAAVRFTETLHDTTGSTVEFSVKDVSAIRIGETRAVDAALAVVGVYNIGELRSKAIVGISFELALSLIDTLLGSNVFAPFARKDRTLTKVESRAAEFAMTILVESFQNSLSRFVEAKFELEQVAETADWGVLGRKGSVVVLCMCRFRACGREGEVVMAIPRSALDPYRDALSRDPNSKGANEDRTWANNLRDQVVRATVTVSATMERKGLTLGDVARFRVGQVIGLPLSPTSLIPLQCADRRLFNCELGQKDGYYTVRIEELIDDKEEFIKSILKE